MSGFEPPAPCVQGRCSPSELHPQLETYKLSNLVGLSGFEPLTSRLSGVRSNQLSYRPASKLLEPASADSHSLLLYTKQEQEELPIGTP